MLRDKNLIPLSRQHQHALALCVRIDRAIQARELDLEPWQAEIQQIYEQEIGIHFAAEELHLFATAQRFAQLQALVQELIGDHAVLRNFFARAAARDMSVKDLQAFAETLSVHIRKEERQLFEEMQQLMNPEELSALGAALDDALKSASEACILPRRQPGCVRKQNSVTPSSVRSTQSSSKIFVRRLWTRLGEAIRELRQMSQLLGQLAGQRAGRETPSPVAVVTAGRVHASFTTQTQHVL